MFCDCQAKYCVRAGYVWDFAEVAASTIGLIVGRMEDCGAAATKISKCVSDNRTMNGRGKRIRASGPLRPERSALPG